MDFLPDGLKNGLSSFWNNGIKTGFTSLSSLVRNIGVIDVLDILIVSIILFAVVRFIRQRRAGKLAAGIIVLLLMLVISSVLGMHIIRYLLESVFQVGLIAVLIVFQPELRSALEKVGGEPLRGIFNFGELRGADQTQLSIREICSAAFDLSKDKTGALIVIERTTKLGDITKTGIYIDAEVNSFLIRNIFFNKAPLHDGALIISDNRIQAGACLLPMSSNNNIIKDLGTRHRAGIGISENSDAVVVIVSEETGIVSVAVEGQLTRKFDRDTLAKTLEAYLMPQTPTKRSGIKRATDNLKKKKRQPKEQNNDAQHQNENNENDKEAES